LEKILEKLIESFKEGEFDGEGSIGLEFRDCKLTIGKRSANINGEIEVKVDKDE